MLVLCTRMNETIMGTTMIGTNRMGTTMMRRSMMRRTRMGRTMMLLRTMMMRTAWSERITQRCSNRQLSDVRRGSFLAARSLTTPCPRS